MKLPEIDAFKSNLPSLLQSPAGRARAAAFISNLYDRTIQENEWAGQYYKRIDPDTGQRANNLDGMESAMHKPRDQGGLGPVVPTQPSLIDPATGKPRSPAEMEKWRNDNVDPGHPYMGWDYPLDPVSGLPMPKDRQGRPNAPTLQLQVRGG